MQGTIIGGGSFFKDGVQRFVLTMIDLDGDRKTARLIGTSFLPHAITIDPNDATKAAVFEKKGPGACLVDLAAAKNLRPLVSPPERHFYGHGAYSTDGTLIYATESYLDDDHRGALVVRDAKTFEELGTVPTFGTAPHDCMLVDDGNTMVVTNGGGVLKGGARPCITYVDLKANKLIEKVELKAPRFNTGHLAINQQGDLAVVSAPREGLPGKGPGLGAISLRPHGAHIATMRKPKKVAERMKGETLSVLIHEAGFDDGERDCVFATHPEGDMVTVWSMRQSKLIRRYDQFEQPRGVCLTLDGAQIVLGHSNGTSVALSFLDARTGEHLADQTIQPSYITGSHIFAHALRTAA